jgi:hypothetical protein
MTQNTRRLISGVLSIFMNMDRITALLQRCDCPKRNFPPTDLYNEGWMLRLVLDWLSVHPGINQDLAFSAADKCYSEALIPSAFLPRVRGDRFGEAWTHADGVIGDFAIPLFYHHANRKRRDHEN